jgi:hypothetical protein
MDNIQPGFFDVFWNDNLDNNRSNHIAKTATYLRTRPLLFADLERNIANDITKHNLDDMKLREIYNKVFPRPLRARNPKGEYETSTIAYRFFFFTYNGQDKPNLDNVPSVFYYKIAECIQATTHWHGTIITVLHYRQTFIHTRIEVKERDLLDLQAIYRGMISVNNYIKGQAPVQRIEAKKTNIYGD